MTLARRAAGVIRDGVAAGAVAGVLSGIPSTAHALATGRAPLDATRAAGRLVARDAGGFRLYAAAAGVHATLSLAWGVVLSTFLPRGHEVAGGTIGGLAIAAFDLGVVGQRVPEIRRLPALPQVADHVAFGLIAGAVLRRARDGGTGAPPGSPPGRGPTP